MLVAFASHSEAQTYEMGKVSKEELAEKVHPTDSTAAAALLYKKGTTDFEFDGEGRFILVHKFEFRYKIYKKEGYDYGNFSKYYYAGTNADRLYFTDCATYNLLDGKIEKTKLKSDGEFIENAQKDYKVKKIALPNVKEGSVVEYKYELRTYNLYELPQYYFQYSIPANFVEYRIRIPQYFTMSKRLLGYLPVEQDQMRVNSLSGNYYEMQYNFKYKNAPALKDEEYVNNIDNFRSKVILEIASYQFPNRPVENLATDWESVCKTLYDEDSFGAELEKKNYFEDDLALILKDKISQDDKINAIYAFVKNKMTYNDRESLYCDEGVKSAYKKNTGNVAEINLMLVAMLRHAGIAANPIILSTRSNGLAFLPSRSAFDYVIAGIELENKLMVLDATDKNLNPNLLPIRALNWFGRVIRENKSSAEVELYATIKSKQYINAITKIETDGTLSGKVRKQSFDYYAYLFRDKYSKESNDAYLEHLEKKYDGLEINDYNRTNDKALDKPIVEDYTFTHNNIVESIGGKLYIKPMLFFTTTTNPFKQEKREYPVDLYFPMLDKTSITITIPEGYKVESLPAPVKLAMEGDLGSFVFNISATENQIQLIVNEDYNSSIFPAEYYQTLKDFIKAIVEKEAEKIVLVKI